MPTIEDAATTTAPIEEVWKILYDPERIPEWWHGVGTVGLEGQDGEGDVTLYLAEQPESPLPLGVAPAGDGRGVLFSCLKSEKVFDWRLEALEDGTRIAVRVDIPERDRRLLEHERAAMSASLRSLAALAATTA